VQANYSKYFPNQARTDYDEKGEVFDVVINSRGFRGRDWQEQKAPGVFRVVTLGASSTFGFHDREDETYPHYLEQYLNEWLRQNPRPGVSSVEVINLGIPHLHSGEILSLYMAEARPLKPDLVTFYEGINDASRTAEDAAERRKGAIRRFSPVASLYRYLRARLITVALFGHLISPLAGPFPAEAVQSHMAGRSERFLENLAAIRDEARRQGSVFVAMNQMTQSETFPREKMRGFTYQAEIDYVRGELATKRGVAIREMYFFTQSRLMADLEKWARANDVPFVDVIAALDQRRDCLVNWVHLSPEGNRILAAAAAAEIRNHIGPPAVAGTR
jgi:lysophospholipase L1-like esterase